MAREQKRSNKQRSYRLEFIIVTVIPFRYFNLLRMQRLNGFRFILLSFVNGVYVDIF